MGERDPPGIDVGGRGRHLDRELPVDRRQVGVERALGRDRVEVDRVLGRRKQLTSGEHDSRRTACGPAKYHFGVYPCLPLNMKPAGSRSIFAAMTLRLAVSWRSSRMA